ncbi:MAG: electron transport complex subunit RsxG [Gammaproteobacteria bacterium]|nr:MAG: electron transport complex subunit RsxG [Gammaproteobacteria bacterium]
MARLGKSISFNSVVLGIFALITASLLAGTYLGTKDRIAAAQREVAKRALLEIVPLDRHTNDLLLDTVPVPANFWHTLGIEGEEVNIARQGDEPVAVIVPAVAPDGYNGDIHLIVGINIDGTLAGVRVVSHHETPGLGDKVDLKKSDWVLGFNGKSLNNPQPDMWKVKKDKGAFDQFTGATITPRAVVKQVYKTLKYYNEDRERLLKAARQQPTVTHQDSEDPDNG